MKVWELVAELAKTPPNHIVRAEIEPEEEVMEVKIANDERNVVWLLGS